MLSAKKVLYAIFFFDEGVAIQVLMKKGKIVIGKYYKDVVLKKLKKYHQKWCPVMGFKHVQMIMPQPIRLPFLEFFFFANREGFYHTLFIHQTLPLVTYSFL